MQLQLHHGTVQRSVQYTLRPFHHRAERAERDTTCGSTVRGQYDVLSGTVQYLRKSLQELEVPMP